MVPAAAEALKHFMFVDRESGTAEEEKKDTQSVLDAPSVPPVKVPHHGPGWMGAWRASGMEKDHCGQAVKAGWGPVVCPGDSSA